MANPQCAVETTNVTDPEEQLPLKPADLRGILRYVPLFRGQSFVISVEGAVLAHEILPHLLTDIAVLRSLHINVVLVHGIGEPLRQLAAQRGVALSDSEGSAPVDAATLGLAEEVSSRCTSQLVAGLTRLGLRVAQVNALRAEPKGILGGVDQGFAGRVLRADTALIHKLLEEETVPVFGPVQCDRDGMPLRLNGDELAAELALRLGASKLIYLTANPGLLLAGQRVLNLPVAELSERLQEHPEDFTPEQLPKAREIVRVLQGGTDRAHLLDGRVFGALLTEIFDKVGLGTMIHADAYQQIRQATSMDAAALHGILRAAARTESVRHRDVDELARLAEHFFVYEVDGGIIACASVTPLEGSRDAELGSVLVLPAYQGKGIGRTMVDFAVREARRLGYSSLFALTTQARGFFQSAGFREGALEDLPPPRRQQLKDSGRNSRVFRCPLAN